MSRRVSCLPPPSLPLLSADPFSFSFSSQFFHVLHGGVHTSFLQHRTNDSSFNAKFMFALALYTLWIYGILASTRDYFFSFLVFLSINSARFGKVKGIFGDNHEANGSSGLV